MCDSTVHSCACNPALLVAADSQSLARCADCWLRRSLVSRTSIVCSVGLITLDDTNSNYADLEDIIAFVIMGFGGLYCVMVSPC